MAQIKSELDAREAEARIRELIEKTGDASGAFEVIGRVLVNRIRLGFRNSRSPWGVPWLPIKFRAPKVQQRPQRGADGSTGYVQRRDAQGRLVLTKVGRAQSDANELARAGKGAAGKPLVDTGRLRNSITYNASKDSVEIGTNARQAKLQHFGGTVVPKSAQMLAFPGPGGEIIFAKRITVPARPFMPINPAGAVMLPPDWTRGVLRELANHLDLVNA